MAHFEIHSFLTAAHGLLGVISVCLLVFGWGRSDRRVPSGMRPVGYTCFPSYRGNGTDEDGSCWWELYWPHRRIQEGRLLKGFNTAMRSLHSGTFWRRHVH